MKSGALLSLPQRECNCWYSCSSRLPFLNLSLLISVSDEIKRCTSCTADISKLNTATGMSWSTAMLRAIDSTKAVLPMPGRAASTIMSERCQPPVILSKSWNPEGTPLTPSSLFRAASMSSNA